MHRLAITWSIPDDYGGMTSSLLHRSRAFARLDGTPVDVLTFDPRPDHPATRDRLAAAGELTHGVRVRNLYDEFRLAPPAAGPVEHEPRPPAPGAETESVAMASDGASVRLTRAGGRRIVEHVRADGSLAVLDEQGRTDAPRRLLTAFDGAGNPVRQWAGAWACYADWVAAVTGGEPAVAIVDSKTMAPFAANLRLPGLATVHVVHNSHLAGDARPYGPLRPTRAGALSRMEHFDGVVFLTERQRDDVVALLSDPGNLHVVPNARELPAGPFAARDPLAGAVVAQLTARKRVDHAIEAVSLADAAGSPVRLTVVGDGPERPRLERLARGRGADVSFAGRRRDGAEAFGAASWMLLTSRSEGAPLVLVEAMGRGCIPVAYDVPYGPADLIEDGVNGCLLADPDPAVAAAAVARLARMPAERLAAMRSAARATAEQFDDEHVTARWAEVERSALERRARPAPPIDARLDRVRLRLRRGRLRLTGWLAQAPPGAEVTATLQAPGTTRVVRRTVRPGRGGRIRVLLGADPTALLVPGRVVASVQVRVGGAHLDLPVEPRHPDTRSPARRAADRVRRIARRG